MGRYLETCVRLKIVWLRVPKHSLFPFLQSAILHRVLCHSWVVCAVLWLVRETVRAFCLWPSRTPYIEPPVFKPVASVNDLLKIMDTVKPYIYDDIAQLEKANQQIMVSLGM